MKTKLIAVCAFVFMAINVLEAVIPKEFRQEYEKEKQLLSKLEQEIAHLRGIAERKVEVRKLSLEGKQEQVKKLFAEDNAVLEKAIADGNYKKANDEYKIVRIIYGKVDFLEDSFLYYKGMLASLGKQADKNDKIIDSFQKLADNYRNFPKQDKTLTLLEKAYLEEGQNEELLGVYQVYITGANSERRYYAAQAYFNMENYTEADKLFQDLLSEPVYRLRSEEMLALSTAMSVNLQDGINQFLTIKDKYKPSTPYYDFILLSLARLYDASNEPGQALSYYEQYATLKKAELSNEVRYEVAMLYFEQKNYAASKLYLEQIVSNASENSYYTSAKFLLANISQEEGKLAEAEQHITDAMQQTKNFLALLNQKYELTIASDKRLEEDNADDEGEKTIREAKFDTLRVALAKVNAEIEKAKAGMDSGRLAQLNTIEKEYVDYNENLEDLQTQIKLLRSTHNKEVPEQIDKELSVLENEKIKLSALQYLSGLDEITLDDYDIAVFIAEEIYYARQQLDLWKDISVLAGRKDRQNIVTQSVSAQQKLQENIGSLEAIASYHFGSFTANNEKSTLIAGEIKSIEANEDSLRSLKTAVVENYNNILANKLDKKKTVLENENEALKAKYTAVLEEMKNDANTQNQRYEYTLLDLLYKRTKELDAQYNKAEDNK